MGMFNRLCRALLIGYVLMLASTDIANAVYVVHGQVTSGPYAYITNYSSNNVSVIDTATDSVTATIPVGYGPYGVVVSPDATKVYVANYAGNSVSVISAATNSVIATIPISTRPYGIAISPDGSRVYVAAYYSNNVSVINTATNAVIAVVPVGQRPHGIVVSRDGKQVYVANYATNDVTIIDATANSVSATIALPANSNPFGLAQTLDSSMLYVTGWTSNAVYAINTATRAVTATIPVGIRPVAAAVTPDSSRVYVSNYNGSTDTTVSVIDRVSNSVIVNIPLPSGVAPSGVSVHPDGGKVYVASYSTDAVYVIDPTTNTLLKNMAVGTRPYAFGSFISIPQPTLSVSVPISGTSNTNGYTVYTNNPTPTITFNYGTQCNGLPCQVGNNYFSTFGLSAQLNTQQIGNLTTFSAVSPIANQPGATASYTPQTRLPDGPYAVNGLVQDRFGRSAQTNYLFTVDTTPPQFLSISPPNGSVSLFTQITVGGMVDDPTANIVISSAGYGASGIGPSFSFPVTLSPGANTFNLQASDPAGNATHSSLSITFTPNLSITSPVEGATINAATTTVTGTFQGPADTKVTVNGVVAAVSGNTFTAAVPVGYGTTTLTATATASGGWTWQGSVNVLGTAITLGIGNPLDGASIAGDSILVTGTLQGPANTGVTVNGVVAAIYNGQFYANNVPLQAGANTLTATYTTADGKTGSQVINVTSTTTSAIHADAEPTAGIGPLLVTVNVANLSGNSLKQIDVDFNGDGAVDFSTTDMSAPIQYTYGAPGIYPAHITATDIAGNVYRQTIMINVLSVDALDSLLQSIWSEIKSKLAAGQIEAALNYFSPFQRDKYRTVLNNIAPSLPAMFTNFPSIYPTQMGEGDVEYFTVLPNNGVNYGYYLYFMQDPDGVWRLHSL